MGLLLLRRFNASGARALAPAALLCCCGAASPARAQSPPAPAQTRNAEAVAVAGKARPADAPRVSPQRKRWEQEVNLLTTPYLLSLYQGDYPALRNTADRMLAGTRDGKADPTTTTARCLAYLMRAEASRVLRDPSTFASSAAGYRREAAGLPAAHPLRGREGALKSYHEPGIAVRAGFVLTPEKLTARGIDPGALDRFVKEADATHSDALLVQKDGVVVAEKYFGSYQSPIALMSVTKPFLCLAVGALLDEGKIKSLDQHVTDFFPQWRGMPRHARITIRHLLTHTSGLKPELPADGEEPDPVAQIRQMQAMSRDLVRYALARPVGDEPGTAYQYSNDALHLLSGVVQRAAGMPADRYVARKFFAPMGVTKYEWLRDEAGHARGADGLSLRAHDLAKFGQLILDRGVWHGNRLLSEKFVAEMLRNQFHGPDAPLARTLGDAETPALGLVWWLKSLPFVAFGERTEAAWRRAGVPAAKIAKMLPYRDRPMAMEAYSTLLHDRLGLAGFDDPEGAKRELGAAVPLGEKVGDRVVSFEHSGSHGQYLIVYPESRLVVVRQVRRVRPANVSGASAAPDTEFAAINDYANALALPRP